MSIFQSPPEPKNLLGGMNFGDAWKDLMGECNKQTAFEMMDYFYENGGNFIDTANNYQNEESETWIGEWLEKKGIRDQMVIATKYTTDFRKYKTDEIQANFVGNNTKSLRVSVDASLKKLKTDYIDLLYIHWWDFSTSVQEVMQSLNQLVVSGKVLYLGVSDTPAWVVSKANQYARDHALRGFSVYQGRWSAAVRDFERDIIPMCISEEMGLCPWGSLGGGNFKTETQRRRLVREGNPGRKMALPSTNDIAVSEVLEVIANRHETIITSVALAYVRQKFPYVVPIAGGRKVEHLRWNIDALKLELTDRDIEEIEAAYPFDIGFPMNFLFRDGIPKQAGPRELTLMNAAGHFDYVQGPAAIKPKK